MNNIFCAVILVFGGMTLGIVAKAAETADDDALTAYEAGKQAFDGQRYAESADHFRTAYTLKPSWKIFYNIGQAEAAGKRYGLALDAFEKYLAEGGDEIPSERQSSVMQEIVRLRNLVGYVSISASDGVAVWLDGVHRGTAPMVRELPVAALVPHELKGMRDGKVVATQSFQVSGGRTVDLSLVPQGPLADAPETSPEKERAPDGTPPPKSGDNAKGGKRTGLFIGGTVAAGVGGVMLIAGAITGGLAISKEKQLEWDCDGGVCPADYDLKAQDQRDRLALATDILLPIGAVVTAAGVALIVVYMIKGKAETNRSSVTWVTPVMVPGNAGVWLKGRF